MTRLALVLVLASLATLALPAQAAPVVTQTLTGPVQELTLANGLKVILKENHASPVVSWVVSYKVGSRNEGPGITGSAHLLEHMMFKGTRTLGKGQVAQILDRNGAASNASTSADWTRYFETYSADRLELGLMVEAARMRDALILDTERQSEMTVVRNELERGESEPYRQLYYALYSTAFKAHPYHHPTIGWRSDVEGVSSAQLKRFYDTYYQPNNAVAVLVGDFKPDQALKLIHRYFDPIPKGPTPPAMHTVEEPQLGERRVVLRRRGQTNMLQLGFHIPGAAHADIAPLLVLDAVLSNGVTGRVYQALVEKKVVTSAFTDVGVYKDPNLFRAGASLEPGADHAKVEQALQAQLDLVKTQPVTAAELAKAKRQAEADYIYENEGTQGVAFSLASMESIATWRRGFQLLDQIKAVQAADLQRVAKTYLTLDNRTAAWYVGTPDGPLPPAVSNLGGGKAEGKGKRGAIHPPFAFERHDAPPRRTTPPVRKVFPNGMVVVVLENPSSQTIALDGYLKGGALEDPSDKQGVAGATAALLDAGTRQRSKLKLAEDLESVSAGLSYSASTNVTNLGGHCLAKDADTLYGALAETLIAPTFPQEELDKLKVRWLAGLRQGEDQPSTRLGRAFSQLIYPPGHPFYVDDLDTQVANIGRITRQDLAAFHQRYHGPNHLELVVVGRVKAEETLAKLGTLFASWPAAPGETPMTIANVAPTPAKRVVVPMPDKTNVEIRVGHATPLLRTSAEYLPAVLANHVLGGSTLTGRLGLKLRDEMGLTYGVGSGFSAGLGGGSWRASVTVNPANVETARQALVGELQRYLKEGVTRQELEFARASFIGSQAVGLATNAGMASSLASIELYGLGLDYWARYPKLVRAVGVEAANAAMRQLLQPGQLQTVIVGPVKP